MCRAVTNEEEAVLRHTSKILAITGRMLLMAGTVLATGPPDQLWTVISWLFGAESRFE
jgi:hypothetical protein